MDTIPTIFIASSSEGLAASNAVEAILTELAPRKLIIHHWKGQFNLSQFYMESLEQQVKECDFGIFVLTSDDLLNSRNTIQAAPRDNVIFELGLFMGSLGRNRCFVFVENTNNGNAVTVPSDLLGLETARFIPPADADWKPVLLPACVKVFKQVRNEVPLYRVPETVPMFMKFREQLMGYWWEKIDNAEAGPVSFMKILADAPYNSLRMEGTSFSASGKISARWESHLVSLVPEEGALIYHWAGRKLNEANISFSGFGKMSFTMPGKPGDGIVTGHGHFFNINEARIKESLFKTIELRKITTTGVTDTMLLANEAEKAALVINLLENW